MTDPAQPTRPRLATLGQVYVSLAAAEQYQRAQGIAGLETARRELTEHMLDAYVTGDRDLGPTPVPCRARIRRLGLDLTAQVVVEGRLLVVTTASARDVNEGRGDVEAQRRRRIIR